MATAKQVAKSREKHGIERLQLYLESGTKEKLTAVIAKHYGPDVKVSISKMLEDIAEGRLRLAKK